MEICILIKHFQVIHLSNVIYILELRIVCVVNITLLEYE
jgi:hypothetical protein